MSIPYVVDGETDLDSLLFNPWIDAINTQVAIDAGTRLDALEAGIANVLSYGADPTGADDSTDAIIAAQAAGHPYFPLQSDGSASEYRITEWIPAVSNRTWYGQGDRTRIVNDRTNADSQKQACILPGLMHPSLFASMTSYALDSIAAGDRAVTCSTSAEAANFSTDELVIIATTSNSSGVPRHAQLTKIDGISSGTITVRDPVALAMSDGLIYKISGTDSSSGNSIYAVENLTVRNLGFEGRSPIATKGCMYNCTYRDLWIECSVFFASNMLTNTVIENLRGTYSGRYMEFANNSYNVIARNWDGRLIAPSGSDTAVLPIHLGEQPYHVLLDDIRCFVPSFNSTLAQIAQLKGSEITIRNPDWAMNGSYANPTVFAVSDSLFSGYPHRNVLIDGGRMSVGSGPRIGLVGTGSGGVADTNPVGVDLRGTLLDGTISSEAVWFYSGSNHRCSARNRSGTAIKVSAACQFPDLTGYQGATLVGAA